MIACYNSGVAWRWGPVTAPLAAIIRRCSVRLPLRCRCRVRGAVVHGILGLGLLPGPAGGGLPGCCGVVDADVDVAPLVVPRKRLAIIVSLGEFGNDVPGVDQARDL